jgi:hypothetical protein
MISPAARFLAACVMAAAVVTAVHAQGGAGDTPMVSFGAGITYGYYDFVSTGTDQILWEGGTGEGFGFVVEYMWNDVFGIHTGLWYGVSFIDLKFDENDPMTIEARTEHIWMPLYLITSYRRGRMGIALLTGLNFMYVRKSEFYGESPMGDMSIDITEYMRYDLYGFAGGLEFKLGITRFIDLFIGGIAEIYARGIIRENERSEDYLYDYRVISGVLFRTY